MCKKKVIFSITHILHYPIQSFTCSTFGASCTTSNMFDTIFLSVEKKKKSVQLILLSSYIQVFILILNNKLFTPSPFMPAFLTQACAAGTAFGVIVAFKAWKGETLLSLQTGLLRHPSATEVCKSLALLNPLEKLSWICLKSLRG